MSYKNDLLRFYRDNGCGLCGKCSYYEDEKCLHEDHPANKADKKANTERSFFSGLASSVNHGLPRRDI